MSDEATLTEVIDFLKGRREELLHWYDEAIPRAGVSFGALEMQCERATTNSLLTELISHFSCVKINQGKIGDKNGYQWEGK